MGIQKLQSNNIDFLKNYMSVIGEGSITTTNGTTFTNFLSIAGEGFLESFYVVPVSAGSSSYDMKTKITIDSQTDIQFYIGNAYPTQAVGMINPSDAYYFDATVSANSNYPIRLRKPTSNSDSVTVLITTSGLNLSTTGLKDIGAYSIMLPEPIYFKNNLILASEEVYNGYHSTFKYYYRYKIKI